MEKIPMADKNSVSDSGANTGEGDVSTPISITKEEANALFKSLRSLEREIKELKAARAEPIFEEPKKVSSKEIDNEKIEMQKQLKQVMAERETEKAEQRSLKLQNSLSESLARNGVDPRHLKHALTASKEFVKYDEEGNLKMKIGALDYDLEDGVKSWAKSEDNKLFMSPKGAVGSGQVGGFNKPQTSDKPDKNAEFRELLKQLPGQF
jgi:hypothetical protein